MPKHYITPNLPPLCWGYRAITLCPFGICYRSGEVRDDPVTRNHELIHWQQQREMLCLLFYPGYILEYLIKLIRFRDHQKAYRGISFEQEASKYEGDPEYLTRRKPYRWVRFMFR
jgi:hypothetical protein